MSLRARILMTSVGLTIIPFLLLAGLLHFEMRGQLTDQVTSRVAGLARTFNAALGGRAQETRAALSALKGEIAGTSESRRIVLGQAGERARLDFAARMMDLLGLEMLQIVSSEGEVLSSGHFRNDYGRRDADLARLLARAPGGHAVMRAQDASGFFLTLASIDSVRLGDALFYLIGGVALDRNLLRQVAGDDLLAAALIYPGEARWAAQTVERTGATARVNPSKRIGALPGVYASDGHVEELLLTNIHYRNKQMVVDAPEASHFVQAVEIPFLLREGYAKERTTRAYIYITYPRAPLQALLRRLHLQFIGLLLVTAAITILLATWLSGRISRPLGELAKQTAEIDIDNLYVRFETRRHDEVGALARLLDSMTQRLRASTGKLREVERRATLGELARQVNHDVKNGLTPIRNAFRHLAQVATEEPAQLPRIFQERRGMLEASISYLEQLAANYARISIRPDRESCQINAIVERVAVAMGNRPSVTIEMELESGLPPIMADTIALRRILENLIRNAGDSFGERGGNVTITTRGAADDAGVAGIELMIGDNGPGIPAENLSRIFDDFYTTKQSGAGLGLSIVRRLVSDCGGAVTVASEIGVGTRFRIWFPAGTP